jgi:hypothetical protein
MDCFSAMVYPISRPKEIDKGAVKSMRRFPPEARQE